MLNTSLGVDSKSAENMVKNLFLKERAKSLNRIIRKVTLFIYTVDRFLGVHGDVCLGRFKQVAVVAYCTPILHTKNSRLHPASSHKHEQNNRAKSARAYLTPLL